MEQVSTACGSGWVNRSASLEVWTHPLPRAGTDFPAAQIIKLEENFRSTQPILDVANAIIEDVKEGYAKRLYSRIEGVRGPVTALAFGG